MSISIMTEAQVNSVWFFVSKEPCGVLYSLPLLLHADHIKPLTVNFFYCSNVTEIMGVMGRSGPQSAFSSLGSRLIVDKR